MSKRKIRLTAFAPLVALLFLTASAKALTINAVSGSFVDVSNAVAAATAGSTVLLPPGTNTWTQTLSLNKGVSIKGSGTNQTVIIDEVSRANNGGQVFNLAGIAGQLTELSNLQIKYGTVNTSYNYFGTVVCSGTNATAWRVDHIFFNGLFAKNIVTYGNASSVVDANVFYMRAIAVTALSYLAGDAGVGDQSYATPPTYGLNSSNVLYIENNYFTNIIGTPAGVCDGEGGARVVFRYNNVWNDFFANHGTETGGRDRSERSFEVYNNTFNYSPTANGYPYYTFASIRGGSGVIFSNTANGYVSIVALRNFRSTDAYGGQWYPFNGADGTNPWDSNSPTLYLSGISSASNGSSYLQVAGANWTNNQWVGYTLVNTNSGYFSPVNSNSANTMYYLGNGLVQSHAPMTFNTGNGFKLYFVSVTLDQPGRGSGDYLRDNGQDSNGKELVINTTTGTPAWPHQVLEPIYFWANTINGITSQAGSAYPGILAGRDYYNGIPKPNYTPFVYPHPLAATHRLTPPTNVQVSTNPPPVP